MDRYSVRTTAVLKLNDSIWSLPQGLIVVVHSGVGESFALQSVKDGYDHCTTELSGCTTSRTCNNWWRQGRSHSVAGRRDTQSPYQDCVPVMVLLLLSQTIFFTFIILRKYYVFQNYSCVSWYISSETVSHFGDKWWSGWIQWYWLKDKETLFLLNAVFVHTLEGLVYALERTSACSSSAESKVLRSDRQRITELNITSTQWTQHHWNSGL